MTKDSANTDNTTATVTDRGYFLQAKRGSEIDDFSEVGESSIDKNFDHRSFRFTLVVISLVDDAAGLSGTNNLSTATRPICHRLRISRDY